ncbi:MAG TPA: hypothetical protein VGK73_21625 [Polyangiaceae bacterium]
MRSLLSPSASRGFSLGWMFLALSAADCTSDHGALGRRPVVAGTSGASGAGAGGNGGTGGGGSSAVGGSSGTTAGSAGQKMVEPTGRSVTTFVHGIVDAERVAWCFARGAGDAGLRGDPEPSGGLAYGEAFTFEKLDGIDLKKDDVSVYVLTGELDLVADLDCEHAVERAREEMEAANPGAGGTGGESGAGGAGGASGEAGAAGAENGGQSGDPAVGGQSGEPSSAVGTAGATLRQEVGGAGQAGGGGEGGTGEIPQPALARLRVAALARFPRGTLSEGYSQLMVAAGCIGGAAFPAEREEEICGVGYTPRTGNLTADLVVLSRLVAYGKVGLQAFHASRAAGQRSVYVVPTEDSLLSPLTIADNLSEGSLRPRQARVDLSSNDLGLQTRGFTVQAYTEGRKVIEESWPVVLGRAGLESPEAGRGYTLIVIGPAEPERWPVWWNRPAFTIVDNDPGEE